MWSESHSVPVPCSAFTACAGFAATVRRRAPIGCHCWEDSTHGWHDTRHNMTANWQTLGTNHSAALYVHVVSCTCHASPGLLPGLCARFCFFPNNQHYNQEGERSNDSGKSGAPGIRGLPIPDFSGDGKVGINSENGHSFKDPCTPRVPTVQVVGCFQSVTARAAFPPSP